MRNKLSLEEMAKTEFVRLTLGSNIHEKGVGKVVSDKVFMTVVDILSRIYQKFNLKMNDKDLHRLSKEFIKHYSGKDITTSLKSFIELTFKDIDDVVVSMKQVGKANIDNINLLFLKKKIDCQKEISETQNRIDRLEVEFTTKWDNVLPVTTPNYSKEFREQIINNTPVAGFSKNIW